MIGKFNLNIEFMKYRALSLVILLWFVTCSIFLFMNMPFIYTSVVHLLNVQHDIKMSSDQIKDNYLLIIRYLQSFFIDNMQTTLPINNVVKTHFLDVRRLILLNNLFMVSMTPILIKILVKLRENKLLWLLKQAFKRIYSFFVFVCVFALIDFNDAFIFFHKLLFRNNDWIFNAKKEPIIILFPDQYFVIGFAFIFIFVTVCYLILLRFINKSNQ
ncbi:TIGR01906 family membrane protein [Apilactobacillus zhangqiuensis]|uniref:TIGR01906 family membrane protein n=1 Tax=Apilactobacillus zhangqiuensis TaxID=2841031 RepID=UPI003571726C